MLQIALSAYLSIAQVSFSNYRIQCIIFKWSIFRALKLIIFLHIFIHLIELSHLIYQSLIPLFSKIAYTNLFIHFVHRFFGYITLFYCLSLQLFNRLFPFFAFFHRFILISSF